jgi:kynurenine 3-monooxygenase
MNIQTLLHCSYYLLLSAILMPHTANSLSNPQAIVVGAGPVGMAASLILASRHGYDVTLLESSPESSSQTKYDPTKAFLYNVNARGQTLTKMFPNMHEKLVARGVESRGFSDATFTIVPADPNVPIPQKKKMDKSFELKQDDHDDSTNKENKKQLQSVTKSEKAASPGYWIPRHEMVTLMAECIQEHNNANTGSNNKAGKISSLTGRECLDVSPGTSGINVKIRTDTSNNITLQANLVIGADGMNSKVRECLSKDPSSSDNDNDATSSYWNAASPKPKSFKLQKYISPASFLRIKVLQLPPRFEIPNTAEDGNSNPLVTNSENIYAIRSIHKGPRTYLSLGLLPMKNNDAVRPTNIVTRPDHEVWTLKDGKSIKSWFEKAFPRMNFDGMISDEEWERFAKAEGTRFPYCQYSKGMAVWDKSGSNGVALVGDAIHAFPPDIGQGVNAGLMDVVCLDRALSGLDTVSGKPISSDSKEPRTLADNLARYQQQHAPEIAALIRLARFGAPYQYRQPHRADKFFRTLWTMNVALRLILNKITFKLIQPSCIILSQRQELTFRQVMRRADLTTVFLKAIVLGAIGVKCNAHFGLWNMLFS